MHPNFIPSKDSGQWITLNNIKIHTGYCIKYKITDRIVRNADKNITESTDGTAIYKSDDNDSAAITTIFSLSNKNQPNDYYYGYTKIRLPVFINLSIYKHNNDTENETVFDNFIKPYDLTDFTFEIKEFVDGDKLIDKRIDFYINTAEPIVPEFNKLPDKIENEYITTEYLYDKRMDSFFEPLGGSVRYFKEIDGYIYVIVNMIVNKRFVMCLPEHVTELKKLVPHIKNKQLLDDIEQYGLDNFNVMHEEKYRAKTPYDLMFRTDFMKIKYAAIEGYNSKFSHEDSYQFMRKNIKTGARTMLEKKLFLVIQQQIFKKKFKDIDYKDICGIVYQFKNRDTGQRYFGQSYAHLYDVINGMYKKAIKGNIKYDKMIKALSEVPFMGWDIKIVAIKKNDDVKTALSGIATSLIMKYNTVETGYNIDSKTEAKERRRGSRSKV